MKKVLLALLLAITGGVYAEDIVLEEDGANTHQGKQPVQVCREVHTDATGKRILGAVVGGVIGHQFGKGSGNTAATVAGAAIGARAAKKRAQTNPEVECHTEYR